MPEKIVWSGWFNEMDEAMGLGHAVEPLEVIHAQLDHYAGSLMVSKYMDGPTQLWLGVAVIDGVVFRTEKCDSMTRVLVEIAKEMEKAGQPKVSE